MSNDCYSIQGRPHDLAEVLRELARLAEAGAAIVEIEIEEDVPGQGPGANVLLSTWLRKLDAQTLFKRWDTMAD